MSETKEESKPQFYAVEKSLLLQALEYLKGNPVTDLYVKLNASVPVTLTEASNPQNLANKDVKPSAN